MKWEQLISGKRLGMESYQGRNHERNNFQRDYDRLIFSAPFRRLQNKTQVFPLPGSVFVHNRLTHSLEVSCVGRSLGNSVGKALMAKHQDHFELFSEIGTIVATACLAHDMGNPPFGHSGEQAIGAYFSEGNGVKLRDAVLKENGRWNDFERFEGNANAIRLLAHQFKGRRPGGFALTYSTLASIVKYPYSSDLAGTKHKFGYFQTEESIYASIADELGIPLASKDPKSFARYPLVYLVEAADDICYQVMDVEDAHKLKILTTDETLGLLLGFFEEPVREKRIRVMSQLDDINEKVAYLRSCAIGVLVDECVRVFLENEDLILTGEMHEPLIAQISTVPKEAYEACSRTAWKKIYRSKEVLDIELAGYRIIGMLLDKYIEAIFTPNHAYSKILLQRIPEQYDTQCSSTYGKIQTILDFISGMTDVYALDLYRKITGMSLPAV